MKKINYSENLLWLSFPALEKFDFLYSGLILRDEIQNLFSNKLNLNKDLKKVLKVITGQEFEVIIPHQVHKNKGAMVNEKKDISSWDFKGTYDWLLTNQKGVFLIIQVADCLPIYLVEPEAKVIGLIHAGWRGTLLGIVDKALEKLQENFKIDLGKLIFILGPGLGQCCFEISEELAILFPKDCLISENNKKPRLNLAQVNFKQLVKGGVKPENITAISECTKCNPELYYSYRRTKDKNQKLFAYISLKS